jgi:hypothetical protein
MNTVSISKEDKKFVTSTTRTVRKLMVRGSECWIDIGKIIYDASERVAAKTLSKQAFHQLYIDAGFTPAQKDKLLVIGKNAERLKSPEMKKYLYNANGWTNIYEIAKLNAQETSRLVETLSTNTRTALTRETIQSFRTDTPTVESVVSLLSVGITKSAIANMTDRQKSRVLETLNTLSDLISEIADMPVKVTTPNTLEKLFAATNDNAATEVAA